MVIYEDFLTLMNPELVLRMGLTIFPIIHWLIIIELDFIMVLIKLVHFSCVLLLFVALTFFFLLTFNFNLAIMALDLEGITFM